MLGLLPVFQERSERDDLDDLDAGGCFCRRRQCRLVGLVRNLEHGGSQIHGVAPAIDKANERNDKAHGELREVVGDVKSWSGT